MGRTCGVVIECGSGEVADQYRVLNGAGGRCGDRSPSRPALHGGFILTERGTVTVRLEFSDLDGPVAFGWKRGAIPPVR
jgi:hypothetical protein